MKSVDYFCLLFFNVSSFYVVKDIVKFQQKKAIAMKSGLGHSHVFLRPSHKTAKKYFERKSTSIRRICYDKKRRFTSFRSEDVNNSSSLSFLNVHAPLFGLLRRMAEPTSFPPPFFPPPKIPLFWGISIAITPSGTQEVLPITAERKYSTWSSPLTFSPSMTLTHHPSPSLLWQSILP